MAGIPKKVLNRASKILNSLSSDAKSTKEIPIDDDKFDQEDFMSSEIIKKIKSIDLNGMTPFEALIKLNELKDDID